MMQVKIVFTVADTNLTGYSENVRGDTKLCFCCIGRGLRTVLVNIACQSLSDCNKLSAC